MLVLSLGEGDADSGLDVLSSMRSIDWCHREILGLHEHYYNNCVLIDFSMCWSILYPHESSSDAKAAKSQHAAQRRQTKNCIIV